MTTTPADAPRRTSFQLQRLDGAVVLAHGLAGIQDRGKYIAETARHASRARAASLAMLERSLGDGPPAEQDGPRVEATVSPV
jgi:hypothetical protein